MSRCFVGKVHHIEGFFHGVFDDFYASYSRGLTYLVPALDQGNGQENPTQSPFYENITSFPAIP